MISLNLNPTDLAEDKQYAIDNYTHANDPYGMYEYFVENDPNAGFINKGLDNAIGGSGNYYYENGGLILFADQAEGILQVRVGGGMRCRVRSRLGLPPIQPVLATDSLGHRCICVCPNPPLQVTSGTIVPDPPTSSPPPPIPPIKSSGTLSNNGGAVGDPHFEGFDKLFDFHGKAECCYQLYKSKSLLINCKMRHAYHCQKNGTFIDGIYVRSYQNGKEFEATFANCGTSDTSHVFIPLKSEELIENLVCQPSMDKFLNEIKNKNWGNDFGVLIKTDVGNVYLVQSKYLNQEHINFKFSPSVIENDTTGIIGQTINMKIRLPNESFEIADINSSDVLKIITPETYTQVII